MTTQASDYLENAAIDHLMGTASTASPAAVYVQLHTGDPGETGAANVAGETTRQAATFTAASARSASSDADVVWSSVSTTETFSHVSIWDAATAGNCLYYGPLSSSVAVDAGDTFTVAAGDLTVSHGGAFTTYAANALLDHFLGTTSFTAPGGLFLKLHTGDPGVDAANNAAGETTRQATGAMSAASGGSSSNNTAITFTNLSTTETLTHVSLWDAATAGNSCLYGALGASKSVTAGDNLEFGAGALVTSLT